MTKLTEECVRRFQPRLYAYCLRLTRDRQGALDLVQDTWLRATPNGLPTDRADDLQFAWLAIVARRLHLRSCLRARLTNSFRAENTSVVRFEESFEINDMFERVEALAMELDSAAFVLLQLRIGSSRVRWKDAADSVGIPVRTAKRRVAILCQKLRARLAPAR